MLALTCVTYSGIKRSIFRDFMLPRRPISPPCFSSLRMKLISSCVGSIKFASYSGEAAPTMHGPALTHNWPLVDFASWPAPLRLYSDRSLALAVMSAAWIGASNFSAKSMIVQTKQRVQCTAIVVMDGPANSSPPI
jgi:hypothetical protein